MPAFDTHQVVEGVFQHQMSFGAHLDVSWFAEEADHRSLLTVKRDSWIVEDLFGLFQLKLNFIHPTVEECAKEARYEDTADAESFESIFQVDRDG